MQIKTFWNILIKIIGLWLLFGCTSVIPQFFTTLSFTNGDLDIESLLMLWLMLFATIGIYMVLVWFFIFKTDWIIRKLKLEQNFTEERIDLNIKSTAIL